MFDTQVRGVEMLLVMDDLYDEVILLQLLESFRFFVFRM